MGKMGLESYGSCAFDIWIDNLVMVFELSLYLWLRMKVDTGCKWTFYTIWSSYIFVSEIDTGWRSILLQGIPIGRQH